MNAYTVVIIGLGFVLLWGFLLREMRQYERWIDELNRNHEILASCLRQRNRQIEKLRRLRYHYAKPTVIVYHDDEIHEGLDVRTAVPIADADYIDHPVVLN